MCKGEHPSGRPIREETEKSLGFARPPREDFLTPSLCARELACAIGFHHIVPDEEEGGVDDKRARRKR